MSIQDLSFPFTDNPSIFSCLTCKLLLTSSILQKEHYKSDWHRYNLKRRIVEMPPISLADFLQKAETQNLKISSLEFPSNTTFRCITCNKLFSSKNQLQNHFSSKKHKSALQISDANDFINVLPTQGKKRSFINSEIIPAPLEVNTCFFCATLSQSTEVHLHHMYMNHGFFLPFSESLINSEGLLSYLAEKVGKYLMCIICGPNKHFGSVQAVMQHMVSKSHTNLDFSDIEDFYEEYGEYYDFTVRSSSSTELELYSDRDEFITFDEDMSLVLPSGSTVGHRAFKYVYKQNLKPHNTSIVSKTSPSKDHTQQMRILRDKNKYCRDKHYHSMKLGVKANKLQTYFTPQF